MGARLLLGRFVYWSKIILNNVCMTFSAMSAWACVQSTFIHSYFPSTMQVIQFIHLFCGIRMRLASVQLAITSEEHT